MTLKLQDWFKSYCDFSGFGGFCLVGKFHHGEWFPGGFLFKQLNTIYNFFFLVSDFFSQIHIYCFLFLLGDHDISMKRKISLVCRSVLTCHNHTRELAEG